MDRMNKNIVFLAIALALAACSSAKEQLGLTRHMPDEFAVVKRAPLSMPPAYGLQPPRPGAPRPQEQSAADLAKQSVFGAEENTGEYSPDGGAEAALLERTGATRADPSIRYKVDRETAELSKENVPVAKKILGLGGTPEDAPASVVRAAKEAERIKKNKEQGQPVTAGDTPAIEN